MHNLHVILGQKRVLAECSMIPYVELPVREGPSRSTNPRRPRSGPALLDASQPYPPTHPLSASGTKDGIEYDRSVVGPGHSGSPDGTIAASDAQLAFAQFKLAYHC
jgi:hypothetical protein